MINRAEIIDRNFVQFCAGPAAEVRADRPRDLAEPVAAPRGGAATLTGRDLLELFASQVLSRHLDLAARELRKQDRGYYTIGSSGHEGNAVVGRATRHTDIAFLHYRSGAFMAERYRQLPGENFIRDTLLSFMASTNDPTAGGRHKVWGSKRLWVPPQTSTIASHLPKAVGAAVALQRAHRLGVAGELPRDAIIVCSFGDASANHSVAQGAFNTAAWTAFQKLPVPVLFVCEDNGIGISVRTPAEWLEHAFRAKVGIKYFGGDGLNLIDAYQAASDAVQYVRTLRQPAFLHLHVVRLMGHAGSDVETEYRTLPDLEAAEARDPLLASARLLLASGYQTPQDLLALYESTRQQIQQVAAELGEQPKLRTPTEINAPLAPYHPQQVLREAERAADTAERVKSFGSAAALPEHQAPRHMAVLINRGLQDLLVKYREMLIFGEDVAAKGGVYHVTTGLSAKFGVGRVFNTLLDETNILGLAIGAGHVGLLPCPEIQYLAYVHNAIDQLRGEACSLQYFSNGQFANPMVVRIASLGYQKGFGGHFHNDNSIAALRDIPGLVIACPARGDDAVKMMRTCMALARVDGRVVAFLEPIALYMTKDLYAPGDSQWQFPYPPPGQAIPLGEGAVYDETARDLTILTFGNGLYMSLRVARQLRDEHGIAARVVDLRWLSPLNETLIAEQAAATGRALVVDEGRYTGGVSEAIITVIHQRCGGDVPARRVVGADTYIPLGPAANAVLPTEAQIASAALDLVRSSATVCPASPARNATPTAEQKLPGRR